MAIFKRKDRKVFTRRAKRVDRALSKVINKMLRKYTDINVQDFTAVLHLKDNYKISEKKIKASDWMCHNTLQQLNLWDEGITILGVDRKGSPYFGSPSGSLELQPDDLITVLRKSGYNQWGSQPQ